MNDEFLPVYHDIAQFLGKWPGPHSASGHSALSDYNLSDVHIDWCLGLIAQIVDRNYVIPQDIDFLRRVNYYEIYDGDVLRHSMLELLDTYGFLTALKYKYSEDIRESYDGEGIR